MDLSPPLETEAAYAKCRTIARARAKNFYYAFLALPPAKRNAICAVYAFMRHADDLSDDESISHGERRIALDRWLSRWHDALAGHTTGDPVFVALLDAQQRYAIPAHLLDQLVEGTATDLRPDPGPSAGADSGSLATYATFADLYRYGYLVASVVGLVSIRIFGYGDPRAEKLAEETGIAFQLTNILRDVREDAERGRVYLPLEDLKRCDVKPEEIALIGAGQPFTPNARRALAILAGRANAFYQSAHALLPLIAPDSRPALWVLVTIYHRLLQRIEQRNFDVFSTKVSVPTHQKLAILGRGILKTVSNRLRPSAFRS